MKSPDKKKKARWYARLPLYIASCRGLTAGEKILLCVILDHIGKHDFGWPSLATLAAKTGTAPRAVHRSIAGLKRRGYIIVESGGAGKSNHYRAGPALLKLKRSWWAAQRALPVKNKRRVLLRQATDRASVGYGHGVSSATDRASVGYGHGVSSATDRASDKHIQGERIPANADNQTKKREGKGCKKRIPSHPGASASSARTCRRLPKKEAPLSKKRAWVLEVIRQKFGSRFSIRGKNFKHDVRALARRCWNLANETGETKRGVLKRVCREVLKVKTWKAPYYITNLLSEVIWESLGPDAASRAYGSARHDGGNGDGLNAAYPGYAGIARRLNDRVQV